MNLTERMTIAEFAVRNPYTFITILNIGWGSAYAAILVSVIVVYNFSRRCLEKFPEKKTLIFLLQMFWAAAHLAAVFTLPLLIVPWEKKLMTSELYGALLLVLSLIVNLVIVWWFVKHFEEIKFNAE